MAHEEAGPAIAVADSSFIIGICLSGVSEFLPQVFDAVCVPGAVWEEVVLHGHDRPGVHFLKTSNCIIRSEVCNKTAVDELISKMGIGESEVLVLAAELGIPNVLVDDTRARRAAVAAGLFVTGTVGFLILLKRKRLISEIKSRLQLLKNSGFHLDNTLIQVALAETGEA